MMGSPSATMRNASQVPWDQTVLNAMMDAENQYSVNSVRGKKGEEIVTSDEQMTML